MNEKGVIIVKIGSGVVVQSNGDVNYTRVSQIFSDIINVLNLGYKVVIVTSGAVASGRFRVVHAKGVPKSHQRQFFSCIGQPRLMQFYSYIAMQYGKLVSQILVSRDSFANRTQYFSIRDTVRNLLNNDIVPIINNNDVLHREDLSFSDNDHLSAYLGGMLNTERVIFLSSVKGLYKKLPSLCDDDLIKSVVDNFDELMQYIGPEKSGQGQGGMRSKINAVKLLFDLGIESHIASGEYPGIVHDIVTNSCKYIHTRFSPKKVKNLTGVRKWLFTGAVPQGTIVVSRLGADVIRRKDNRGSLLSIGVLEVAGTFSKGDVVSVCDEGRALLGYGIVRYSSSEISQLLGKESIIIIHADYFYGLDRGYFD